MVQEASAASSESANEIIWRPTPEAIAASRLGQFMARHGIADLAELQRRSVTELAWFWDAVVRDLDLEFYEPYTRVLDSSRGIAWTRWWIDGAFNYVHNAVDRRARGASATRTAVIWEGEDGAARQFTFAELDAAVGRAANALRALGVGKGDRVGIYMPMIPETVVATLACGKIGAIYTPIFSGFGAPAVATRLRDCDAKVLITADGFYRRGKVVGLKDVADAALAETPSVEHVVVVRRVGSAVALSDGRDRWWHELVDGQSPVAETERTDAEDPFMIIYTSGTTGRPKGTLHVHGGFPIKAAQDLAHCFDLRASDVLFWFTDMGWMMGPWEVAGGLALGSTIVLYEGAPDYPRPDRLWEMIARHRVTVFGVSPTVVRALMPLGTEWVRRHDRGSLRILGSTGEVWNEEPYRWFFEEVGGRRCPIINYSGGTEISGGIVGGLPIAPLKSCCFTGAVPGMAADVVDDRGRPVRGQVGELVIRQPWPGMTRGFWRDSERYLETYWSRLPETWVHGDWAMIDEDGFWFILGRSDDTIKVAGKRVGPAEVESAAVSHPAVAEAAAIGVPDDVKGEKIVCLVTLRPGQAPSEELREAIRDAVTAHVGKSLRPDAVRFVTELPKTRNGKVLRRLIRAKYLVQADLGDLSSLENPSALEAIARSR